jgi:pyroglutamyl-peptidase
MSGTLITTFQTWLPHQVSNSADDLIAHLLATGQLVDRELVDRELVDRDQADRDQADRDQVDRDQVDREWDNCHCLRHIPVDFGVAPWQVIAKITAIQPDRVLCCGMAESRSVLSIESNGYFQSDYCFTTVDLMSLMAVTKTTIISHNAGRFVCNHLYYQVLRYLAATNSPIPCLFIHVPLLNEDNRPAIAADFVAIIKTLCPDKPLGRKPSSYP